MNRTRPTPMAWLGLAWLVVIDAVNGLAVGPISGGAVLTVATVGVAALAAFGVLAGAYAGKPGREPLLEGKQRTPGWFGLFVLYAWVTLPLPPSVEGVQNVLVYTAFVLTIYVSANVASERTADVLLGRLAPLGYLVAGVTLAPALVGVEAIYAPRAVAMVLILLLAVNVARSGSMWLSVVLLAATVSTLSRTATVVAIAILFLGLAVRGRRSGRLGRVVVLSTLGLVAAWQLITRYPPLRDRFLGGDAGFDYAGVTFNTSGRAHLWETTWRLAQDDLWFGSGAGTAVEEVLVRFATIAHPHNDYLRLLHDFGVVGLALFVLGYATLLRRTWVRGRAANHPVHWAAFLALTAVAVLALTDNAFVYPFAMVPLGLLVGASLARPPCAGPPSGPDADTVEPAPGVVVPEDHLGEPRHRNLR